MKQHTKKTPLKSELGYINVRISKKSHRELVRRSIEERRTIVSQLDIILGV